MPATPVRHARIDRNLTLHRLSTKAAVSMGRLSLIERGLEQPTPEEQRRIAKALRRAARDLFGSSAVSAGNAQTTPQ
jgi:transcriptional regulator with XRE-family HTH domain